MAIDDLRRIQVLHAVAAGVTDVEDGGIHLERRRSENAVLVAHDLLDVANESPPLHRCGLAVVMHHRSIDAIVDVEGVDHQRRSNFGRRIDEPIIILETIVRLIGRPCVAIDDMPARGEIDVQCHRIRLVIDDVQKHGCAVPVRVRGVDDTERSRQRVRVDVVMRIE